MKLDKLAHDLTVWTLIIASIFLVIISAIVRDYNYIVQNTKGFVIEMIMFSFLPPLVISLVFFKTRKVTIKDTLVWYCLMVIKFAVFHILFQLSGIYTIFFKQ